jgi:hypothetical protein
MLLMILGRITFGPVSCSILQLLGLQIAHAIGAFGPNAVPLVGRLNVPLLIFAKKNSNQYDCMNIHTNK